MNRLEAASKRRCSHCKQTFKPGETAIECPTCRWHCCQRCNRLSRQRGHSQVAGGLHLGQWGAASDFLAYLASKVSQEVTDLKEMATELQSPLSVCERPSVMQEEVAIEVPDLVQKEQRAGERDACVQKEQ